MSRLTDPHPDPKIEAFIQAEVEKAIARGPISEAAQREIAAALSGPREQDRPARSA